MGEMKFKGESKFKWELNSLFLSGSYINYDDKGKISFRGKEKFGYDLRKKKYFSIWRDNFASMFLSSYGTYDEEKRQFFFEGKQDNIMEDIVDQPYQYVYTLNDNGYVMEMFQEKDGKYTRCLQVEAVRSNRKDYVSHKETEGTEETKITNVHLVSLVVNDVDEALAFYVDILKFIKVKDVPYGEGRWVVIRAPHQSGLELTISKATSEAQKNVVGKQAGDGVFLVLNTTDIQFEYERLKDKVNFKYGPKEEFWGTEALFTDLYGNQIDLVQPKLH
jgi:catechol 2,3-dioxygenase-like lactoylglutathione lyase family enzyme